jgi:hypothetical protein
MPYFKGNVIIIGLFQNKLGHRLLPIAQSLVHPPQLKPDSKQKSFIPS